MNKSTMEHGDFTNLAEDYSKFRPAYSPAVLSALLSIVGKMNTEIEYADVGAGTGIWTRMVVQRIGKGVAIEPNDSMRKHGQQDNGKLAIQWLKGKAEATTLKDSSLDLVTMASSFHWADFNQAIKEFNRILRPGGYFTALWNPRLIEVNPLLVEIENKLKELIPDMKRVSSGRSDFCNTLTNHLSNCSYFENVLYVEGRHVEEFTPERYLGVWRSVNDIRVQAGPQRFEEFLNYVKKRIAGLKCIEATYLTRAWIAQKKLNAHR